MRRALPPLAVLALLAPALLAGCLGEGDAPAALGEPPGPAVLPEGVFVHGGPDAADALARAAQAASSLAPMLHALGVDSFEPTLGVAPDGAIFYSVTPGRGVAIGVAPGTYRSRDGGATWEDVSPRLPTGHAAPPETNDPYVYVDPDTGRVFQFSMAPILVCSVLSWSDDQGASWTTNPRGCGNAPPWDHQTMVAARPVSATPSGYANVLHQCVNQLAASWCARSLDGGLTWTPGTPASVNDCGGLHGHLAAAPDGTIYLPRDACGATKLVVSRDDGLTWETTTVSDERTQAWSDPAVAVDDEGNVYVAWIAKKGALRLSASADGGATWSAPVTASPPGVTAHLPTLAAGEAGKIALAYAGTLDLPDGYDTPREAQDAARWHGFVATSVDALSEAPAFQTVRATPAEDPLVRGRCGPGRCPGMTDFIDVVIGTDGRPYAAFVDACSRECHQGAEGENDGRAALLATIEGAPPLRAPATPLDAAS